ncbi:MAG: hypothetical protein U0U69_15045 [Acidimicrobiia bacterium]
MKKRRFPSLRRQVPDADPAGVVFEDLPPDERSSEVVMHPSPTDTAEPGDDDDDTKPRPSMPAAAVIVHDARDTSTESERPPVDDDYVFRPPADAEPDAEPAIGETDQGGLEPAVPDVVVDADVRAEVLEATAVSTFVDAPPGAGVTSILVDRAVAGLRGGGPGQATVTVITRDSGTAALFRDRLRDALETAAREEPDDVTRRRLGAAVGRLRTMFVGPGVELAESILRRWPEAAGLAPGFEIVTPPRARLDFESSFRAWLAARGGAEPAVARALARGVTANQIHDIAVALTRHAGLAVTSTAQGPARGDLPEPDLAWLLEDSRRRIGELVELAVHGADGDDAVVQIRTLQRWLGNAAGSDDDFAGHFLVNAPTKVRSTGSRANWDPPETCATQMERCRELAALWSDARRALGRSTITTLVEALTTFVEDGRRDRRRSGRLYPTDAVPTAVDLLAGDTAVLHSERDRHGVVVVDDVWDLDAPSLSLVLMLCSLDDDVGDPLTLRPGQGRLVAGGAATTATLRSLGADPLLVTRLRDRAMTPLRLRTVFRQSPALVGWTAAAYRTLFADDPDVQVEVPAATPAPVPTVEPAEEAGAGGEAEPAGDTVGATGAGAPEVGTPDTGASEADAAPQTRDATEADPASAIATNEIPLPSQRSVLTPEGHLMAVPEPAPPRDDTGDDAGDDAAGADAPTTGASPEVAADVAAPTPAPDPAEWGAVVAAWHPAETGEPAAQRAAEAHAAAAALRALVDSSVPCVRDAGGSLRPATWADCALVLGSATGVETYVDALEAAAIPTSRAPAGVEFLRRQEAQDLLAVLRAALDPADTISTIAALRGLAFGCSDSTLVAAVAAAGGPLAAAAVPPEGTPTAVAEGLQILARIGDGRDLPALDLVDLTLELTRFEEAVAQARGADPGVVDSLRTLAAHWCGREGSAVDLVELAAAASRPLGPPATVSRAPLPAVTDAVEVLTVAEARGREFPVVAVANLHPPRVPVPVAVADHASGRLHLRAGRPERGLVTAGFDAALARDDEQYLAQRSRLVCAAFSRARDKLVVAFANPPAALDSRAEVPTRELVRRVGRLLAEADPETDGGLGARAGVTLVPVAGLGLAVLTAEEDSGADAATPPPPEPSREPAVQAHRSVSTLGVAPEDPLHAALALAVSRADFDTAPVAMAPVPPDAISAACREVGAHASEAEVAALLDTLTSTDLWARADNAERILRRPSVFLDGGPAGAFADRLDLALVEDGAVTGVMLTLSGVDARLGSRVALGTHALALTAGMPVGAALVYDARTGDLVEMGPAEVAEAVGTDLS